MGDPNAPTLDARRLIETLDAHGVSYVVVGGFAATVYGASRPTFDIDVVPGWDNDNLTRLGGALRDLGARLRVPGLESPVEFALDADALRRFEVSTWRTDAGDIDVIIGIPTAQDNRLRIFDDLRQVATEHTIYGTVVLIAGLDDIIESKEALGRTPDLVALTELYDLRAALKRSRAEDQ